MSNLERFIENNLKSIDLAGVQDLKLAREQIYEVIEIAPKSIASHMGIGIGDRLLLVDGRPANQLPLDEYFQSDGDQVLLVERASGSERLEIRTRGASPGLALRAMEPETQEQADSLTEYETLVKKWNQGSWRGIRDECQRRLHPGVAKKLALIVGRKSTESSPASLMQAVAKYELGDRHRSMVEIERLNARYGKEWPRPCRAIVNYYEAKELLKAKQRRRAEKLLIEAIELWPCERITQFLAVVEGRRTENRISWLGKEFPERYALPDLRHGGDVSLDQALSDMSSHQYLLVTLMGGFRSNAKYARMVRRFMHLYRYFQPVVTGMHVVTTQRDRAVGASLPEHLHDEERALRMRLPIWVLYDRNHVVTDRIKPDTSPLPMLLDHRGHIVSIGMLDDLQWWQLLEKALDPPASAQRD